MSVPDRIFHDWRSSGLRVITWSFFESARPVRHKRRHSRNHWLFYLLLAGHAELGLAGGALAFEAPAMVLLRPEEGFAENLAPRAGRVLLASNDFEIVALPGFGDPLRLLQMPACVPIANPEMAETSIAAFRTTVGSANDRRMRGRALLDQVLTEFLITGFAEGKLRLTGHAVPRWLVDLRAALFQRWNDATMDLDGIARLAGVERYRLCREFRRHFGLPPMAWLRRERLSNACRMLRHAESTPVAEVARACGFSSPVQFSRHFHALYGMAPRIWRHMAVGEAEAREDDGRVLGG